MTKIYLLGFMGSGKSYAGRALAQQLGWQFYDLDTLIEVAAAQSITSIFEQEGAAYFRTLEAECLRNLYPSTAAVIALGGGTPCFHENMAWIKAQKQVSSIFLDPPIATLIQRLKAETTQRPLLQGKSLAALQTYIQQTLAERRPFYEQADYQVQDNTTLLALVKQQILVE